MTMEGLTIANHGGACDNSGELCVTDMSQLLREEGDKLYMPHVHDCYHIIWFSGGSGVHEVDFEKHTLSGGTLFFLSPGQIHAFDRDSSHEGTVIRFCEQFLSDESSIESVFLKYDLFNAFESLPYLRVDDSNRRMLEYMLDSMRHELTNPGAFAHKDYLRHLLHLFLITIQRCGNNSTEKRLCINCQPDRLFVRFRQQLEHHFRSKHSVQEYSDLLNVSTKTLTRSVSDVANTTPLKMINARIALEARRLLQYSDMKIKEIGYDLGFDDPSNFVKFFKRQTGNMPTYYREMQ